MKKNKSFWWFINPTNNLLWSLEFDNTLTNKDKRTIENLVQMESTYNSIGTGIISALFVLGFVMVFIIGI